MTTKERIEVRIKQLEDEQNEIIALANRTKSIDFIISLGNQANKNKELLSFAKANIRLK